MTWKRLEGEEVGLELPLNRSQELSPNLTPFKNLVALKVRSRQRHAHLVVIARARFVPFLTQRPGSEPAQARRIVGRQFIQYSPQPLHNGYKTKRK